MNDLISIIIPIYNAERYLHRCLESVINQTYSNLEIICINDGSTDGSLDILKDYIQKDRRIKLIDFNKNKGVSIARNTAIECAKGAYIGFVDSDDWIDLDFYEKLYNKAIENNSNLAIGNIRYKINDRFIYSNFIDKVKKNYLNFNVNFYIAIYKATFLKRNNLNFTEGSNLGEDRELPIKSVVLSGNDCPIVDDVFYTYFKTDNSLCNSAINETKIKGLTQAWKNIALFLKNTTNLSQNNYVYLRDFLLKEYSIYFIITSNELLEKLSLGFIDVMSCFDLYEINDNYLNKVTSLLKSEKYIEAKEFVKIARYKKQIKYIRESVK